MGENQGGFREVYPESRVSRPEYQEYRSEEEARYEEEARVARDEPTCDEPTCRTLVIPRLGITSILKI